MSDQQNVPAYLPTDFEIIKQTQQDGTVVFMHPMGEVTGETIETDEIDLYSLNHRWLTQIQALVDMLGDDEYTTFGSICEILINNTLLELDETFSFIQRSIGHIEIGRIPRKTCCYRTDRVVQVSVKPPEKEVDHGRS